MSKKIIQILLLLFILVSSNIAFAQWGPKPSYKQGFARSQGESAYPNLRNSLSFAFLPSMGVTGATAHDVGVYKTRGAISSDVTWEERFSNGRALAYGGTSGITTFGDSDAFSVGEDFTFAFWFRRIGGGTNEIMSKYQIADNQRTFLMTTNNTTMTIRTSNDGIAWADENISVSLALGVWNHLVLSVKKGVCSYYENGILEDTITLDYYPLYNSTAPFLLAYLGYGSDYGNIAIGDFLIYKRSLGVVEIQALYHDMLAPFRLRQQGIFRVPEVGGAEETQVIIISSIVDKLNKFVSCVYR